MTKHEAVGHALIQYTGKRVSFNDVRLAAGSMRLASRFGYSEGEEWAVVVGAVEQSTPGYVVFLRHGADGWFVFQDEIEEVEFDSWPPPAKSVEDYHGSRHSNGVR